MKCFAGITTSSPAAARLTLRPACSSHWWHIRQVVTVALPLGCRPFYSPIRSNPISCCPFTVLRSIRKGKVGKENEFGRVFQLRHRGQFSHASPVPMSAWTTAESVAGGPRTRCLFGAGVLKAVGRTKAITRRPISGSCLTQMGSNAQAK